jgi:hypothetical protein
VDVLVGPGARLCSANFGFLAAHDEQLLRLAALAERYFADDPNTSLIKLRQFSELLAQQVAARYRLLTTSEEPQADLLRRLKLDAGLRRSRLLCGWRRPRWECRPRHRPSPFSMLHWMS